MTVKIPQEEELRKRILEHLGARPDHDRVVLAWFAYLAALNEWGIIEPHVFIRLTSLLPPSQGSEVAEIMVGTEYVDAHPEHFH